jgi:hypothetical protein
MKQRIITESKILFISLISHSNTFCLLHMKKCNKILYYDGSYIPSTYFNGDAKICK